MGTVGDLVAKLFCDSSNFDKNIKKSQKEVQEFKRKTEQNAAKVSGAFNSMGSAVAKVNPGLGNIIGSLGKVAPLAAAGTAAFGLFKQVVQQSETAMDNLEKKTSQLEGAWEHITTTMSNGNIFSGMTSSLQEAVRLAGELAEIIDNLGTLSGYRNLDNSEAEFNLSKLKEMIKAGASKEDIAKQVEKTKASLSRFDIDSGKIVAGLKAEYNNLLESFYTDIKRGGRVGLQSGKHFIEKFATDTDWRTSIESWNTYFDKNVKNRFGKYTKLDSLKTNKTFEKFLKGAGLYDSYLFNDFKRGGSEGEEYVKDIISIITGVIKKKEDSKYGIENIQKTRAAWLDIERESSEKHTSLYKRLGESLNKPAKAKSGGGGSVYTSKQEAPKERTLQDILDDLDKSLTWNKYLAQNLGEDITGANLSTLEKTANELKDLLKNTTDEEQRKQILSVLKTMYNIINEPKKINKPIDNANFKNIYGNEIGNLSLNEKSAEYKRINEDRNKEIEEELKKNTPENFRSYGALGGLSLQEAISADIAKEFKYDADRFLKDRYSGEPSDIVKRIVQSIFNAFKLNDFGLNASLYNSALDTSPNNNKISSFIPFGELSKLKIPIKYPEEFYSSSLASAKFSSGVASIVKKYTGFDNFRGDFAKNAYSEFDRLISEGAIIKPEDVNKILYKVYLDTIRKHSDDTPDFFKNYSDFYKFIKDRTDINFNDEKTKSKVNLILGEKNKNELIYQEILNNISAPKEAKVEVGDNIHTVNTKSRAINPINFETDYIIRFINEFSKGNIYEKAVILKSIKDALIERRGALTNLVATVDTSEDRIKLNDGYKKLRLIQLEKEKRSNKGVLSEENQKEYEDLKKETSMDFSGFTNVELDTTEETFTRDIEKLAKDIEETNRVREDLEDKINQTDDIGERVKKEEEENNVLRERQKELSELSNKYMSVADSAYQIGAAFSTLDSKFGDIASVLLNVVGITAEAIGKLIGMATAEGVSNAFKLPWPQNLAAVATVIAAGASAAGQIAGLSSKKYATGGIVTGPGTSISDSIPIRVSNGEMILNHRQQSNLFNLLDKGGSKSKLSGGEVEFKISGSSLVGVLRNYNNINNKVR